MQVLGKEEAVVVLVVMQGKKKTDVIERNLLLVELVAAVTARAASTMTGLGPLGPAAATAETRMMDSRWKRSEAIVLGGKMMKDLDLLHPRKAIAVVIAVTMMVFLGLPTHLLIAAIAGAMMMGLPWMHLPIAATTTAVQ